MPAAFEITSLGLRGRMEKLQAILGDLKKSNARELQELYKSLPGKPDSEERTAWINAVEEAATLQGLFGSTYTIAIRNIALRHHLCPTPKNRGEKIDLKVINSLFRFTRVLHDTLEAKAGFIT